MADAARKVPKVDVEIEGGGSATPPQPTITTHSVTKTIYSSSSANDNASPGSAGGKRSGASSQSSPANDNASPNNTGAAGSKGSGVPAQSPSPANTNRSASSSGNSSSPTNTKEGSGSDVASGGAAVGKASEDGNSKNKSGSVDNEKDGAEQKDKPNEGEKNNKDDSGKEKDGSEKETDKNGEPHEGEKSDKEDGEKTKDEKDKAPPQNEEAKEDASRKTAGQAKEPGTDTSNKTPGSTSQQPQGATAAPTRDKVDQNAAPVANPAQQRQSPTSPQGSRGAVPPQNAQPPRSGGRPPDQSPNANTSNRPEGQPGGNNNRPGGDGVNSSKRSSENKRASRLNNGDKKKTGDTASLPKGKNSTPTPKPPTGASAPGASTGKGGIKKQVVEKSVGKVVDKLGSKVGLSPVKKQFIVHLVVLILEFISGIGIILFIFHVLGLIVWLAQKGRWKEVGMLLLPFILLGVGGFLTIFLVLTVGGGIIACQIGQSRIPFGIPMNVASRVGSWFHSGTGDLAQLCDQLNLLTPGVGGSSGSAGGGSGTNSRRAVSTNNDFGATFVDGVDGVDDTPIFPNTLLTRPQSLPPEFATQSNQAGYVSPAHCKLGDLPYSSEKSLQRVALPDGTTTVITLPVHQTVECSSVDPTKGSVRSVHIGKIVRLVYADEKLGDYVTIEYPNKLRVTYYHLRLLPELTLGKMVSAGETIGNLSQTGPAPFEGVIMRFEYQVNSGAWEPFDPINTQNSALSILTPFPCVDDAANRCLLL